jgi:hypothetical protein
MGNNQEPYPNKIRSIAEDMSQFRSMAELDYSVGKLRKIADGLEAIESESQSGTCKQCGASFAANPSDGVFQGDAKEAPATHKLEGKGIAEFFIAMGGFSVVVGVALLVFSLISNSSVWILPTVATLNGGLITVMLGVLARTVVVNANTNLKLLKHFENLKE